MLMSSATDAFLLDTACRCFLVLTPTQVITSLLVFYTCPRLAKLVSLVAWSRTRMLSYVD